jgi:hypothetical protein
MVHAEHNLKSLDLIKKFQQTKKERNFNLWLGKEEKQKRVSRSDRLLIDEMSANDSDITELFASVEGFMNIFHLSAIPETAGTKQESSIDFAFFELLGVIENNRGRPWASVQVSPEIRQKVLTRLKEYYKILDEPHKKKLNEWVDIQQKKSWNKDLKAEDFFSNLKQIMI